MKNIAIRMALSYYDRSKTIIFMTALNYLIFLFSAVNYFSQKTTLSLVAFCLGIVILIIAIFYTYVFILIKKNSRSELEKQVS